MRNRNARTLWSILATTSWLLIAAAHSHAESIDHVNDHPQIQMWSYPASSADGAGSVRNRAPTFAGFSAIDEDTGQAVYYPGSAISPSRRASMLIATNTSLDISSGLASRRYQIDSLSITATLMGSLVYEDAGFVLPYDGSLDSQAELTTVGGGDTGHPIEMYGVGLQGDYSGIGFGGSQGSSDFQLGDVRWRPIREGEPGYDPSLPANEQATAPYQYFAIDAEGRDVENSVVGGYSATDPSGATPAFTPEPFAIGKMFDLQGVEYEAGTLLTNGDQFVFEPDLTDEGVIEYLQRSLSDGALAFMFSSMHQPNGHLGTAPYPDFYLDDLDVGPNPDGEAPRLKLSVTLLPAAGDYNNDGVVDTGDYDLWKSQHGSTGPEADGNRDGVVDAADYCVWRDNLTDGTPESSATLAPEPSASAMVALVLLSSAFSGWAEWIARPARGGEEQS